MKSEELLGKYQSIWNRYEASTFNVSTPSHVYKLLDRDFVFQYDWNETECEILFIGINPSYKGHNPKERRFYTREGALQHRYFQPFKRLLRNYKFIIPSNSNGRILIVWFSVKPIKNTLSMYYSKTMRHSIS